MALDIERPLGWRTAMGSAVRSFLGRVSGPVSEHSPDAGEARSSIPLVERLMGLGASVKDRLNFRSLYWRILLANLFGLLVMLAGIVGVSQHQAWLIEAKTESLRAQGEILAAAIAANATGDERGVAFPDPDRLLEAGPGASVVAGGYGGEDFEFQIRPEKVARFLHRMTAPSGIRARIYDADLTMIYDTRGIERRPSRRDSDSVIVTQNVWTWLDSLFVPSNLNHYKEIGSANGSAYAEVRNALAGVAHSMIQVTDRGRHIVSVATPIRRTDKVIGVLLMATRDGDIDGILRKERHMISWVFAIAVITTALSAAFLAKTIAGPMRRLSEAAERVRNSMRTREDFPAFANRKDEIGQMAGSFRDMTAAMYRRIELSEKFAADVAHELKNPITAVRSATESLSYVQSDEDRKELLHNINKDLSRLNKLITDISNFSRLDADLVLRGDEPVEIDKLLQALATVFNDVHRRDDGSGPVDVACSGDPSLFVVSGHETRLTQVFTNLIDNAISFLPPDGRVTISARRHEREIEVCVEDNGPGIPADKLEAIFGRFYTDRPDSESLRGKNSGLGLSISREIVEAHGGRIWAENCESSDGTGSTTGARLTVRLPATGGTGVGRGGRRN